MENYTKRLIAIGASIASNCSSCLEYNRNKALEDGIDVRDISGAIEIGRMVRNKSAAKMDEFAHNLSPVNSSVVHECGCKG